jgi:hypothetical protein
MPPEQLAQMSLSGLLFTLTMAITLFVLPRRFALVPLALITCYVTFGQQIVVAGLHFTMLRLLVLVGVFRVVVRGDTRGFEWLKIDKILLAWVFSSVLAYTLLWGTTEAFINRLGLAYDSIGLYFIFRCLIRDFDDVRKLSKVFAFLLVPLAVSMCAEKMSGRNPFYVLGGVPEYTAIREGVLRCQGPFLHPILAGTFGAIWLPLSVGLWTQGKGYRFSAFLGIVSSTIITLLAGSSGPLGSYMAGWIGILVWPLRQKMRMVRWGIVAALVAVQASMDAPLWFIFAHVNIMSGSTGWHRSFLIDRTIANFFDWWLIGTKDTAAWGVWAGDITNQFILEGVRGGLVTMLLFIAIVVLAFSGLGVAMREVKDKSRRDHLLIWAIGSTVFAHIVSFFGVSYFDQNIVNWYLILGIIATVFTLHKHVSDDLPTATAEPDIHNGNMPGSLPEYVIRH